MPAEILTYARGFHGDQIEIKPGSSVFLDACFILGWFQEHNLCVELLDDVDSIKGYFKSSRGQDIFRPHYKNVVDQLAKFINNFGLKIIEQGQDTFIESQKIIANDS